MYIRPIDQCRQGALRSTAHPVSFGFIPTPFFATIVWDRENLSETLYRKSDYIKKVLLFICTQENIFRATWFICIYLWFYYTFLSVILFRIMCFFINWKFQWYLHMPHVYNTCIYILYFIFVYVCIHVYVYSK